MEPSKSFIYLKYYQQDVQKKHILHPSLLCCCMLSLSNCHISQFKTTIVSFGNISLSLSLSLSVPVAVVVVEVPVVEPVPELLDLGLKLADELVLGVVVHVDDRPAKAPEKRLVHSKCFNQSLPKSIVVTELGTFGIF